MFEIQKSNYKRKEITSWTSESVEVTSLGGKFLKSNLDGMPRSEIVKRFDITEDEFEKWSQESRISDLLTKSSNGMTGLRQLKKDNQRLKKENQYLKQLILGRKQKNK
ncbi:hypothetical protein [Brevibacillus parabrevis]|uniref:hypothetical protein n=1 Tax=Brevibacillus parabrevis TaxID=54914 RepID=UPI001F6165C1|nr:hypothetical protein [Brevibacillus parabrevis]MDR5000138.1 hypothetical protein [Brevibacillus parabrevis]